MKLMYGNVPVKSMNIHSYELSTNDCTMVASDLQAGVTAVARGQKITGTGKAFSFACYGDSITNLPYVIPDNINIIQIGSIQHPVRMTMPLKDMRTHDFSIAQKMAEIVINGTVYPITVSAVNGILTIACDETVDIELFFGKDEYA